jgi:hypothetical protein
MRQRQLRQLRQLKFLFVRMSSGRCHVSQKSQVSQSQVLQFKKLKWILTGIAGHTAMP